MVTFCEHILKHILSPSVPLWWQWSNCTVTNWHQVIHKMCSVWVSSHDSPSIWTHRSWPGLDDPVPHRTDFEPLHLDMSDFLLWFPFVFRHYYLRSSEMVTVGVTVLCVCRLCLGGSVPHRAAAVSSSYNMTHLCVMLFQWFRRFVPVIIVQVSLVIEIIIHIIYRLAWITTEYLWNYLFSYIGYDGQITGIMICNMLHC